MRVVVLVSLLLSLSLHAQTFEQVTFIRVDEQQSSVRGAAMGGVSDDDPVLNPAALAEVKRPFVSLSGLQLEPLDGKGLAHALVAMPVGSFVVAAHYRSTPALQGPQPLPAGGTGPRTEPACGDFGCFIHVIGGGMFERIDRRYGVNGAWTSGRLSLGAGAELHHVDERMGLGIFGPTQVGAGPTDLLIMRISGREVVPNAGVRFRVTPRVAVAAAYNGGGTFSRVVEACQLPEIFSTQCASEYTPVNAMTQRSPSAIRASVTVQPLEGLTVTGEAVRRGYSEVLEGGTFVADLLQDVTEIHAGAEYRIRNVALRAGWWSDPSRYDAAFFGGFSPFGRSNDHLTFGAGVDVGRARLELAVDHADEPSLRKAMVGIRLQ